MLYQTTDSIGGLLGRLLLPSLVVALRKNLFDGAGAPAPVPSPSGNWYNVHLGIGMTRNMSKVPTSKSEWGSGVMHTTYRYCRVLI